MAAGLSNWFSGSNWRDATGWYDFTIPAGYVPGSGLTLNVDIQFFGSDGVTIPMWACGATANGSSLTSVGLANDQITVATMAVGTEIVSFCAAAEPVQNVPHTRGVISFPINAVNRNAQGWSQLFGAGLPFILLNGGAVVLDGSAVPPPYSADPGSGWLEQPPPSGGDPGYDTAYWPCSVVPLPTIGGYGSGEGPTAGTVTLQPGDVVSIIFWIWPAASFFTLGQILIYGMTVDCGAGGVQTLNLANTYVVSSFDDPSHASRPVPVSTTPGNIGGHYTWISEVVPDQPSTTSQGYIF